MSVVQEIPNFSAARVKEIARDHFGLEVTVKSLDGERDQNSYLEETSGRRFVLKVANKIERREVLEFQNRVMSHLNRDNRRPLCPAIVPSLTGEEIVSVDNNSKEPHYVRLLTFIEGAPLAKVHPHTPELLYELGGFIGRVADKLRSLPPQPCQPDLIWNLRHGPATVGKFKRFIGERNRRLLVKHFLQLYENKTASLLPHLTTGITHNDGNDYNIIVSPPDTGAETFGQRRIAGIIDFGDLTLSYTLSDLAITAAYAILSSPDPLAAAARIVAGYHAVLPLSASEIEVLYPMICLRLILSVSICAYQKQQNPENRYLTISEKPVWDLLDRLHSVHEDFALYTLRHACGLEPNPHTGKITNWLRDHQNQIGQVTPFDLKTGRKTVFDFGIGSRLFTDPGLAADPRALSALLFGEMKRNDTYVGIGRYNENRLVYTSPLFQSGNNELAETRTLHLGIDLIVKPGTAVSAPLDGTVHSFRNNTDKLDYGPTIILEHLVDGSAENPTVFYTLYGHLSRKSLAGLRKGKPVKKGEPLATVGNFPTNGGWVPHLHFQIITNMLNFKGDYPGVARYSEKDIWLSLCPDPNLILGIPGSDLTFDSFSPSEIMSLRTNHIGGSLSIAYRKPLKIERGLGQYLYDHTGRKYLDAVNNVPHVGHSHPKVVEAAGGQMAVLNTNTRYLHDLLVQYAERLTASLPDPLQVCFIVNSGSEANDLALRLAWNFTGERDIICVDGAYHGNLSSLIDISPYKFNGPGGSGKPPYTQVAIMPDLYRGPYLYGDPRAGEKYAEHVRQAIEEIRKEGRNAAAFICESLLGCGGQIVLPENYLRETYGHVRRTGGLCIADEVQVGFGRVGSHFWGFQLQGVVPDIVTCGKPIGDGHPLAAVVTTPEIAAAFANGMEYFNTYGGNPVSCAVGLAVLDIIREERLQENALSVGYHLKTELRRLKAKHLLIGDVRGEGLFLGVELVRDRQTRQPAPDHAEYIANRLREEGILISTDGPFHNVLKIKPPLAFTRANADLLAETLDALFSEDPVRIG